MIKLRLAALWIGTAALFVFVLPLCIILLLWEKLSGERSRYWPYS